MNSSLTEYHHDEWETQRNVLRFLLKYIGFTTLAKIDRVEGLENVPTEGSAILMINHIAFIDPIVVLNVLPRNIVPLAKTEVYEYPIIGILPKMWGVIPVKREDIDRYAVRQVLQVLGAGEIVLVAPEGTRSPALTRAKEGIAYLANRSGAKVVPVAIDGTIGFPAFRFSSAWQAEGAYVQFGKPFRFKSEINRPGRNLLRKMTDEAMYVLARMLPEKRRGVYSDLSHASEDTLEWL